MPVNLRASVIPREHRRAQGEAGAGLGETRSSSPVWREKEGMGPQPSSLPGSAVQGEQPGPPRAVHTPSPLLWAALQLILCPAGPPVRTLSSPNEHGCPPTPTPAAGLGFHQSRTSVPWEPLPSKMSAAPACWGLAGGGPGQKIQPITALVTKGWMNEGE